MTRLLTSVALSALVCSGVAKAPQRATFSSGTLGVRVDVLVTKAGRPIAGLTAEDFEVRDNGVPQRVSLASVADLPVNAVLVLDTSESTSGPKLTRLVEAAHGLVDRLHSADRAALITFSHAVNLRVPSTADFRLI